MDYFEVHDGVAVQKWSQTQSGSTPTPSTQSPILNYLGSGTEVKKVGVFPSITETSFVGFYNTTFEQSEGTIASTATIGNTVSMINEKGFSTPNSNVPNKLIFSPFGSLYYLIEFEEQ